MRAGALAMVTCLALAACGVGQPPNDEARDPAPDAPPDADAEADPTRESEATATPSPPGELQAHFIDVGQGDATLLVAPGATVLVDAGRHTATDVVDYLDRHGVERIDVLAVTHPHADHIGQFDRILEHVAVSEVWWSPAVHTSQTYERALTALEESGAAFEEPTAGARTDVGPLRFDFTNPPRGGATGELHDDTLAFRVAYGDVSFLFTGDAEARTEERMLTGQPASLAADVYQVGHHGSSTSTSQRFLDAVGPDVAIYSAGRDNQYGHPHEEVVDRLLRSGAAVYGTDVHGTVVVTTDGDGIGIRTATRAPVLAQPRSGQ